MNRLRMPPHRLLAFTALAVSGLLAPVLASADDTEVFFSRTATGDGNAANVLFMFDLSGSMDEYDGTPDRRITRVKKAMLDILESSGGVNIGLGAFNGHEEGAAILYPVTDPDADVCAGATCEEISIRVPIRHGDDDAAQRPDAGMVLDGGVLDLTRTDRVGLRFTGVDIPRGARIERAVVEFTSTADLDDDPASIVVRAEASDDARPFRAVAGDIGDRARTSAGVLWEPRSWSAYTLPYRTGDLAPVVQEIVNRDGWCGGNALALLMEGAGRRRAHSFDSSEWEAPVLKVTYDPSSIDLATTCTARSAVAAIGSANDDADELLGAGTVDVGATSLDVTRGDRPREVGLRFTGIDVPQGASITGARVELSGTGLDTGEASLELRAERAADADPFAPGPTFDLTSRTAPATALAWNGVPVTAAGERLVSPDLSSLIGGIVADPDWTSGNAIALTLRRGAGSGRRSYRSYEAGVATAPRLRIDYRYEAAGSTAPAEPLRTARDDMIDAVLDFRTGTRTQIADAYLESALYMLGRPVDYGARRGRQGTNDRWHRLSNPGTYTGGTLFRPEGCTALDPDARACIEEEIRDGAVYVAPEVGACQANQIVLLSDGEATRNSAEDRIGALTGGGCAARGNEAENCALELADWLYADVPDDRTPVITHTIGFNFTSEFLRRVASDGGGRFQEADSAGALAGVFRNILDEAATVDTSFVAPAATVSQFNRLTNRDDIYYAMFRPSLSTRWEGNLKRYELGKVSGSDETVIVDALGEPVFDAVSGGIRVGAKSFWTDGAADGPNVVAGGAAHELTPARKLRTYLDTPLGPSPLMDLSESNALITSAVLGIDATDAEHRTKLLRWARGVDVKDHDGDANVTEPRRQIGDPMHSTPFVLNYAAKVDEADGEADGEEPGEEADEGRSIVFFGTNEGFLHAIDASDGSETFGFVPPDLLPNLDRFYRDENDTDRPYGLDGPVGGWFDDRNDNLVVDPGESAWVYVGMRRGGRNYYALDVSDPDEPSLAWVIRGGQGDFGELGQSWSRPILARMLHEGEPREVLVFGAGYATASDRRETRNQNGLQDDSGRGIYIVDARTGAYLSGVTSTDFVDMTYSIPSDLNVVDIDLDGLADMIWVGDMGGQLWRFDIGASESGAAGSAIDGYVVGDFGDDTASGNRRFFYPPDIALVRDDGGEIFMNVGIGSGWRAHPLDTVVEDRFYTLRERAFFGPPRDEEGLVDYADTLEESDLHDATSGSVRDDESGRSSEGWYLGFAGAGEKVLGSAITVDRQLLFTTYLPGARTDDSCGVSVGGGRLYVLDAVYGDAVLDLDDSGGEPVISDRSRALAAAGIPPPVSVLIPESAATESDDDPVGLVGLEKVDELDFGPSLRRTYWTEE